MKLSLYFLGAMAVAAGAFAEADIVAKRGILQPRDYMQPQIDAMNFASAEKDELFRQMNAWDGKNWDKVNKIAEKHDDFVNRLYEAAKSFEPISLLTIEEEETLTPAATLLYNNMVDYARFFKNNYNKWQRWKDNTKGEQSAKTKMDRAKAASDRWMHDFFTKMKKSRWENALELLKIYDKAFKESRDLYK